MATSDLGLPTLTIHGDGPILRDAVVMLDGLEVRGLRSLSLTMADDEMNTVTLTIEPGEVRVSADVIAALQALVAQEADA